MEREEAYAKINLYLEVTARREDGYHDLFSIMQTVSLSDTLTFTPLREDEVRLCCNADLPLDGNNLILRAAHAFFARIGRSFGVQIELEKRIPVSAGLGGGSADAAAALRALNRMAGAPLTADELREVGLTVGADVPFLVEGGTAICRGVGERIEPISAPAGGALVVAIDGEGVSTPRAFSALDVRHNRYAAYVPRPVPSGLIKALQTGDAAGVRAGLYNSFEEVILPERPKANALKKLLTRLGGSALMSGSGPSVFALFDGAKAARSAEAHLRELGICAVACEMKTPFAGASL